MRSIKKIYLVLIFGFVVNNFHSQEITPELIEKVSSNPSVLENLNNLANSNDLTMPEDKSQNSDLSIDNPENENRFTNNGMFGANYINKIPKSISASSDLPVPNDYIVSLGDELKLIYTGSRQTVFNVEVNLDGTIFIPELGQLQVSGDSYEQVKEKIRNLIEVSYVGVNVNVSLANLNAKKISIVGAVNMPGTYLVNPFTTISNALSYSGGVENFASLRDIEVIRGEERISYDLYELLMSGDRSRDINIEQGDTILVKSTSNFIKVDGAVNRPSIYEFKDTESLDDIIAFALGMKKNANKNNIVITDYTPNLDIIRATEYKYQDNLQLSDFNNPISIEVFAMESSNSFQISVTGPLENGGIFNYKEYKNLKDLIKDLKFTNILNPYIGVVQNGNISKLFSIKDPSTHNIDLFDNSEVLFFSTVDNVFTDIRLTDNSKTLLNDYRLRVSFRGNQIDFPAFGELPVKEVVNYLGLDMTDVNEEKTTYISPLEDLVVEESWKSLIIKIKKFNTLSFRNYSAKTINVTVSGEVALPGNYEIKSNTSLMDLYELVGGLTNIADENITLFTRESVRDKNIASLKKARQQLNEFLISNIQEGDQVDDRILALAAGELEISNLGRISGDFNFNSKTNEDFYLQDGDTLFIPKKVITTSIIGEVLNPITILHREDLTLDKFVNLAGGYNQYALKRSAYVIRANGEVVKSRGIFRGSLKVYPGDTVVIPRDYDIRDDWRSTLVPITSILSNLAFASASLSTIQ